MSGSPRSRRAISSVLFFSALMLIGLASLFMTRRLTAAGTFTPGNLVTVRMGDGSAVLGSAATPVFLDEFETTGGSAVQTVAMPTTASGANLRFTDSGSATSDGALNRSVDGRYLALAAYDAALGTANVASAPGIARVIGRVAADGTIDTTTRITDGYTNNNIRSAATDDGTRFWAAGAGGSSGGTRYVLLGASTSTQIASDLTNTRVVNIFDSQLHVSSASGTFLGVSKVGTGLPTTSGQTTELLPGFPTSGSSSSYAFALLDRDPGVPGIDTAYVADDRSAASGGGIQKWTFNATTWSLAYTLALGSGSGGGAHGVTADASGSSVILYATTTETAANRLVKVTDTGAGSLFTTLATAAANTVFRGVAFAPESGGVTLPAVTLLVSTNSASEAAQTVVTVTATASSAVVGDQTVIVGASGTGITAGDYTFSSSIITIPNGMTSGSVTFTVVDDTLVEATETATLTISNPSAGITIGSPASQNISIADNDVAPACSSGIITAIHDIQGVGNTAAITGMVTVTGVVVGDYEGPSPALRGFYLQDPTPDDDPATSEGIFVFEGNNANAVSIGSVVQVTGTATEFQDQTEIDATTIEDCNMTATVWPVDVALPVPPDVNGVPYLERFEGMLVRFHQTLYVTEHFQLGRFGQIVMSSGARLPQPTSIVAPGAPAQSQQAANNLNRLIVDDEQNSQNPDPIRFGRNLNPLSALNTLRGGDTATDLVGVMTYGWAGNAASGNAYRLRPINALHSGVPNFQPANARPATPPGVGGSLKVVGMNVLNYFLTLDNGQAICGPIGSKQQCRGAEDPEELARQQQKLNQALLKIDADIIGMSELENTQNAQGQDVNPPADIVDRLNTALQGNVYGYIDSGVIGTDTIRVGIIYKKATVTPVGGPLVDTNVVHSRPPVAQFFTEISSGERFSVVVNHFKSKGSCPSGTGDPNADQGDGQGCWNVQRTQQAQALVSFVTNTVVPSSAGDPDVMLIGDFNAYAKEDPIRTLEAAGFTNLVSRFSGPSAYSYVFDAQWGYIDHALVSTSMLTQVTGAGDYHINADEPSVLDYNTNFKSAGQRVSLYNADEFRIADHDPVLIGLALHRFPTATLDSYTVEAGTTLSVGGQGVLGNDTGGPLAIFSHTTPGHGRLTLNANGSFTYAPAPGFFGVDGFQYTVSNATPLHSLQLYSTNLPALTTIGGVNVTAGAFGSAIAPVPGSTDEFYGLTDRGPNVDGPDGTKIEPMPSFTPSIAKFKLIGGQAVLEQVIPLQDANGNPYSGRVNAQAATGETITDLDGSVLVSDVNGYDPEGLVVLADGTFWVSDAYGPFISHFDATGKQIGRLSPFDGSLPFELRNRVVNRGMEGLTITSDGSMLVGIMQSALQQDDLLGFDAKRLTPLRIVTYTLATGTVREYLYLLDNPNTTKTAVSEITALSNSIFLVDERDGNVPPGAYKKIFMIDTSGATDVGPASAVAGAIYDGPNGGLLVSGKTLENLLRNGGTPFDASTSASTLVANGITPVLKGLHVDLGALLDSVDVQGKFFGHDKIEGVAAINGGGTLVITNDSDFGIDGITNSTPPFQLHAKITPAGVQDDGEFLVLDLVRSTATVTINVVDTVAPETLLTSVPSNPTNSSTAGFAFAGSDSGSGVAGFECALDGPTFVPCTSGVTYHGLADGSHTFAVRAIDGAGHVDASPDSYSWVQDTPPDRHRAPRSRIRR